MLHFVISKDYSQKEPKQIPVFCKNPALFAIALLIVCRDQSLVIKRQASLSLLHVRLWPKQEYRVYNRKYPVITGNILSLS